MITTFNDEEGVKQKLPLHLPICLTRFIGDNHKCKRKVTFGETICDKPKAEASDDLNTEILNSSNIFLQDAGGESSIFFGDHDQYEFSEGQTICF